MREAFASAEGSGSAVEVRWGQAEDGASVADLLKLNGMPRWVAFEELFVVADERGEVTAAVRYRVGRERLLLGLLVADPWRDRGALAEVLYSGARALAWEAGIPTVVARVAREMPASVAAAGTCKRMRPPFPTRPRSRPGAPCDGRSPSGVACASRSSAPPPATREGDGVVAAEKLSRPDCEFAETVTRRGGNGCGSLVTRHASPSGTA